MSLDEAFIERTVESVRVVVGDQPKLEEIVRETISSVRVHLTGGDQPFELTKPEAEVMSYLVNGYSNKEIARFLNLSESGVKDRLGRIYKKIGVSNRVEAAVILSKGSARV